MRRHLHAGLLVRVVIGGLLAGAVLWLGGLATAGAERASWLGPERLAISLVSGLLYVAVLTPLARRLPARSRRVRLAGLFVPLYGTGTLVDLIEASAFTTLLTPASLVAALLIGAVPALLVAGIVAVCIPSVGAAQQTAPWRERSLASWAWRVLLAGLLYVPAYYGFAALVAPIEHPFYSDPTLVGLLQTRTPPDSIIVPLETVRGALFALALVPVLAVFPSRRWSTLVYLTLIGLIIEAVVPLLGRTTWPLAMRLGNFGELTGDALSRAVVALALLGFPPLIAAERPPWRHVTAPRHGLSR